MNTKNRCFVALLFGTAILASAQTAGDFQTHHSGDWKEVGVWERFDGVKWITPAPRAPSSSDGIISILSGHEITISEDLVLDQFVVTTGGTATIKDGVRVTILDGPGTDINIKGGMLTVGGILRSYGTFGTSGASIGFLSGGKYEHAANNNNLPKSAAGGKVWWDANSTIEVTGITTGSVTSLFDVATTYGNVIWDCPGMTASNVHLNGNLKNLAGYFRMVSSGGGPTIVRFFPSTQTNQSLNIAGDLILEGGSLQYCGGFSTGCTMNIGGNFSETGGSFAANTDGSNALAMNLKGVNKSFAHSGGTLTDTNLDWTVKSSASISLTSYLSVDDGNVLTVESGGTLVLAAPLSVSNLTVGGTIINSVGGSISSSGVLLFQAGSLYRHAQDGGSLPKATWAAGSTCEVTGVVLTAPSNGNQNFHNFTWNCPAQTENLNLDWNGNTIGGDVIVGSTGSGRWVMCAPIAGTPSVHSIADVTIQGNIVQTGGVFSSNGTSNGYTDITIHTLGTITVTGGTFSVSRGSQGGTGTTTWILSGDISLSNATTQNSNLAGAKFFLAKPGKQTLSIGAGNTLLCLPLEVRSGTIFRIEGGILEGAGDFTLNAGSTLECCHAGGIDYVLANSGAKTLSSNADYTFSGTVAQITGTLLPPTVRNLTVNNTAGVVLSASTTVTGQLSITAGHLDLNGNTITLGPSATLNETSGNTVNGSSGYITTTRTLTAPRSIDNIAGMGLKIGSNNDLGSTVIARGHASQVGDGNTGIRRYFDIAPSTNSGLDATLVVMYDDTELNGITESDLRLFVSEDHGSSWMLTPGILDTGNKTLTVAGLDGLSRWTAAGSHGPLPIQLSSFAASPIGISRIKLEWCTLSELNNYGFYVQKRKEAQSDWIELTNSFVPGHGTTNDPQRYSVVDSTATREILHYRLKQVDLDRSVHFSEEVRVDATTGIHVDAVPTDFALFQNYPNPFNPTTMIRLALPQRANVSLKLFNAVGQEVRTILNGPMEIGYHQVRVNAGGLASGIYFYRMWANAFISTKRLILVK